MINFQVIILLLIMVACTGKQDKTTDIHQTVLKDTIIKHDTVFYSNDNDWQQGFGLTHDPDVDSVWNKPVRFYINNSKCSPIAIDFYRGEFRPGDNYTTAALLSLVTTNDSTLRPFYRWCLNKIILIQDGALAEYTGAPARQYAEKFPKEFFEYMDYDTTGDKYADWVNSILYSGFYEKDDCKKPADIRNRMSKTMRENCGNCNAQLQQRIDKFANDCFQQAE